jgi:hypothetical protein
MDMNDTNDFIHFSVCRLTVKTGLLLTLSESTPSRDGRAWWANLDTWLEIFLETKGFYERLAHFFNLFFLLKE